MCATFVREHLTELECFCVVGLGVGWSGWLPAKWELMPWLADHCYCMGWASEDSGFVSLGDVDCVGCAFHITTKLSQQTFCETTETVATITGPFHFHRLHVCLVWFGVPVHIFEAIFLKYVRAGGELRSVEHTLLSNAI